MSSTSAQRRGVVVVTGATGGVGRATARRFADDGYDVAVLARGADGLDAVAAEIRERGRRVLAVPTDVADAAAVRSAAERVESELGPIDVWVSNAMTTVFAPVTEIGPDEFERATRVTYLGQVHGAMAALRHMRGRDRGVIVSVGSALAFRSIALQAPYCGAKFAARGFHESLRTELLHEGSGVRVTQVHLPAVNTTQFGWCRNRMDRGAMPVPPMYQPEVAARAIVGAARRAPRQKILGTWNWLLVQATQLVPGVVDHFAARSTWDGQLTDEPNDPTRAGNLFEPVDGPGGGDRGSHGPFDDRSGGVLDPSFLRSLPGTVATLVGAFGRRARELGAAWRRRSTGTATSGVRP